MNCLNLFSDCNLLIHFAMLFFNSKSSNNFMYFLFTMEKSVNHLLDCFRKFDYETKIHFLLDDSKSFRKLMITNNKMFKSYYCKSNYPLTYSTFKVFLSDSPAALELHYNITRRMFFENLANALFLAVISPICWEPPYLSE